MGPNWAIDHKSRMRDQIDSTRRDESIAINFFRYVHPLRRYAHFYVLRILLTSKWAKLHRIINGYK